MPPKMFQMMPPEQETTLEIHAQGDPILEFMVK